MIASKINMECATCPDHFPGIFVVLVGPAGISMYREMFTAMNGGGAMRMFLSASSIICTV